MAHDPVCHMEVDEQKTSLKSEYRGQTYYFCSAMCKERFDKEPERYLIPPLPNSLHGKKPQNDS